MNKEGLWEESTYSEEEYVSEPFDETMIKRIEDKLGYKLPQSYIELMKEHNGGILKRCIFFYGDQEREEYIVVNGMFGIGETKDYSLGGSMGSRFWVEEWEYPNIGVAICDCPSAGHEMIFLDYRECIIGRDEPRVVYIDQEADYDTIVLAETFEEFINGLKSDEEIEG